MFVCIYMYIVIPLHQTSFIWDKFFKLCRDVQNRKCSRMKLRICLNHCKHLRRCGKCFYKLYLKMKVHSSFHYIDISSYFNVSLYRVHKIYHSNCLLTYMKVLSLLVTALNVVYSLLYISFIVVKTFMDNIY